MTNTPQPERDFEQALRFLAEKMPDAKDLEKPTLIHSVRVGVYLYNHNCDISICIAGLLHDLVEDSDIKLEDLRGKFGEKVAELVSANTKNNSLPKDQIYIELLERCINSGEEASIIKAADTLDNLIYYRAIDDQEGISNMLNFGRILLHLKPENFENEIFAELQKEIG